jgi:hypothetical protein
MLLPVSIKNIFKLSLLVSLLISFYIFINTIFFNSSHKSLFSTWQFPMLLAIFLEVWLEKM